MVVECNSKLYKVDNNPKDSFCGVVKHSEEIANFTLIEKGKFRENSMLSNLVIIALISRNFCESGESKFLQIFNCMCVVSCSISQELECHFKTRTT